MNTVLCTAIAESFDAMCTAIDAGQAPLAIAAKMLEDSWPIIFNGNGYGAEWPIEAEKRGLHIENSNPEAIEVRGSHTRLSPLPNRRPSPLVRAVL